MESVLASGGRAGNSCDYRILPKDSGTNINELKGCAVATTQRSQGNFKVGAFAYRFILKFKRPAQPGASFTTSEGALISRDSLRNETETN